MQKLLQLLHCMVINEQIYRKAAVRSSSVGDESENNVTSSYIWWKEAKKKIKNSPSENLIICKYNTSKKKTALQNRKRPHAIKAIPKPYLSVPITHSLMISFILVWRYTHRFNMLLDSTMFQWKFINAHIGKLLYDVIINCPVYVYVRATIVMGDTKSFWIGRMLCDAPFHLPPT